MVFRDAAFGAPDRAARAERRALAGWSDTALFLIATLLVAAGSRALLHDVIQHDPPFFAEVARLWRAGVLPYVGAFDVKPPGLFALFALTQAIFGDNYLAVQVLQVISEIAVAVAMRSIGVRMGSPSAGAFAGLMYIVCASFVVLNNVGYAPFVALTAFGVRAMLEFDGRSLRHVWTAGLLLGLAFTIKQTAAVSGFALFCLLLASPAPFSRRLRVGLVYIAAAAAPALAFCVYFAAHGALRPMLEQTVVAAVFRSAGGPDDLSYLGGLGYFLMKSLPVLPALWLAVLAAFKQRDLRQALPRARLDVLVWWFAAEVATVILQRAGLRQYLSPLLAPGLLLMSLLVVLEGSMWRVKTPARKFATLVVACLMLSPIRFGLLAVRDDNPTLARIAEAVRERELPDDRVLVMNDALWLYTMTGLHPPQPVFNPMHLLCAFPGAGEDPMQDAIDARPRFIVVRRDFKGDVGCALPERWATFDAGMAAYYAPPSVFPTSEGYYELFVLKGDNESAN